MKGQLIEHEIADPLPANFINESMIGELDFDPELSLSMRTLLLKLQNKKIMSNLSVDDALVIIQAGFILTPVHELIHLLEISKEQFDTYLKDIFLTGKYLGNLYINTQVMARAAKGNEKFLMLAVTMRGLVNPSVDIQVTHTKALDIKTVSNYDK